MRTIIGKIFKVCPRSGRIVGIRLHRRWTLIVFPLIGIAALAWFAIRVIPKPSRAAYPCQKAALPIVAGFIVWLAGITGGFIFYKKAKEFFRARRYLLAGAAAVAFIAIGMWSFRSEIYAFTFRSGANIPQGTGRGMYPGRVVWTHDPAATSWEKTTGQWWQDAYNNQAAVDLMVSRSIQKLSGTTSDSAAWNALFRSFNIRKGRGDIGYQAAEKIAIKINENNDAGSGYPDGTSINASAHLILSLLKTLITGAGVPQSNITVSDPSRLVKNSIFIKCTNVFPAVRFVDNVGSNGRVKAAYISNAMPFSVANGSTSRHIASCFVEAAYLIDMAILKGHTGQGVTLCGKNWFGATGIFWDYRTNGPEHGYFNAPTSGANSYMKFVDYMGHKDLGEKTVLFMIDSLYAHNSVGGAPQNKWKMPPFNNDWPSSILVSQDGVAIDSVGVDLITSEFPTMPDLNYCDYYLLEAALANSPPSGTLYDPEKDGTRLTSLGVFEHWNNTNAKQYSGNLFPGSGKGIELIYIGTNSDLTTPSVPSGLVANAATESNVALRWTPSTDNVAVSGYVVYRNGNYLTNVSSTNFTDSGLASNTTYAYQVAAYDALPNISARSISVNVKTDRTPPSVAITSPANNAKYAARAYPTVTAAASDIGSAVVKVEFYTNGGKVGEDTNASGGWTCLMPGLTAGTYALTAKAFDAVNNSATSAAITITVTNPAATNVYQAESYAAKNSGTIFGSGYKGYSGSGYMDYGSINSYLEWTNVIVTNSGTFRLTFRYAIGNNIGSRPCVARVGNSNIGSMTFIYTGSWSNWQTVYIDVPLVNGTNRVRLTATSNTGGPNLDTMTVTTTGGALPMAMMENTASPVQPVALAVTPDGRGGPAICELLTLKDVQLVFDRASKNMKITYTALKDYDDTDVLTLELYAGGMNRTAAVLSGPESMIMTARSAELTLSDEPSSCLMRVHSQDGDRATEYMAVIPVTGIQKKTGDLFAVNNPYRGSGGISINNIPAGSTVSIYSLSGKHIADLGTVSIDGGSVLWNAKDMNGSAAAPGVYICRTKTGNKVSTVRIMIAANAERP